MNLYVWEQDGEFVAFAMAHHVAQAKELILRTLPATMSVEARKELLRATPLMISTPQGFNVWRGLSED